jgi:ubiquinone/menaquinone biosynthesis C-methylase UbiE
MSEYNLNQRFLDPEKVLFRAGLSAGETVADFGAGSGFYALSAGKMVGQNGIVYVVDVLESALEHVSADARLRMLKNIRTLTADLETSNLKQIPDGSCDMVIFANVLHQIKNRKNLLAQAYRALKTGGKLLVIDWNDKPGPIGPKAGMRVAEDEVEKFLVQSGLRMDSKIETDPYHYGLIFIK